MRPAAGRQHGVSLIEALVALAIMAFGMMGLVGVQATLRLNADLSRQRTEAVRIAERAIEDARSFAVIPSTVDVPDYQEIQSAAAAPVDAANTNTTYMLTQTVTRVVQPVVDAVSDSDPRAKTVQIEVKWTNRAGTEESIRLATTIAANPPGLAGSLGVPTESGGPTRQPLSRNPAIPPTAVTQSDGTSTFQPPGASGVTWTFNNATGVITRICTGPDTCSDVTALLLSGYVRFATLATQPQPSDAEIPPSAAMAIGFDVELTAPTTSSVACYVSNPAGSAYVAYFCPVPVTAGTPRWSGQSKVLGLSLAASLTDPTATLYRVCRYTPGRNEDSNSDGIADGDKPLAGNIGHPLIYTDVDGPLANQNFLVIRAGDGGSAFSCPADDSLTPLINGNTWNHQPSDAP